MCPVLTPMLRFVASNRSLLVSVSSLERGWVLAAQKDCEWKKHLENEQEQ